MPTVGASQGQILAAQQLGLGGTSTDPGRQSGGFVSGGTSTDPGRSGDPALIPETPGQTALLNEQARLDAQAAGDSANAAAETARSGVNLSEADAYRIAAGQAGSNADLEMQSASLSAMQKAREVRASIGSQRAGVATAGFAESGTDISLLRDSMAQGSITDALTKLQGNIAAAGFKGQQAAATAEQSAAMSNSDAALALAGQYSAAGVLATSQSANLAAQLALNPDLTNAGNNGNIFAGALGPAGGGGSGATSFVVKPSKDTLGMDLTNTSSPLGTGGHAPADTSGGAPQTDTAQLPAFSPVIPDSGAIDTSSGTDYGGVGSS